MIQPCRLVKKDGVDHWCEHPHQRFHAGHHLKWALGTDEESIAKRATWDKLAGLVPEKVVRLITPPHLPDVEVNPTSDLLVITVAVGQQSGELHAITGSGQQAYATKCGADYVAITGAPICASYPMLDKFRIYTYAKRYKRVLFLDCDAMVRSDCPNLFEMYPEETVALHDDTKWNEKFDFREEAMQIADLQGIPYPSNFGLLNTGVVLSSARHLDIWKPPTKQISTFWCSEQHLIGLRILNAGYKVALLPRRFNWQWWLHNDHPSSNLAGMCIIHAAGFMNNPGGPGSHQRRIEWLKDRVREDQQGMESFAIPSPALIKLDKPHFRHSEEVERCKFIGLHLTQVEVNEYRQQLLEGKIPCRTCQGNAPGGIPARHCSSPDMGPFTWFGKCSTCKGWAEK